MNPVEDKIAAVVEVEELFGSQPADKPFSPSPDPGFVIWAFSPDPAGRDDVVMPIAM